MDRWQIYLVDITGMVARFIESFFFLFPFSKRGILQSHAWLEVTDLPSLYLFLMNPAEIEQRYIFWL